MMKQETVKTTIKSASAHEQEPDYISQLSKSAIHPLLESADPSFTYERRGEITYQVYGLTPGKNVIDTKGPVLERQFTYLGTERSEDKLNISPPVFGDESVAHILDCVESKELDPSRELQHPDGRTRVFDGTPYLTVQWQGVHLRGGKIAGNGTTMARAGIYSISANTIEYNGATDNQFYIHWVIPKPCFPDEAYSGAPRVLGSFTLSVFNATRGKHLFTRPTLELPSGSPGKIVYAPLENDLILNFKQDLSVGDVIRVELNHHAYGSVDGVDQNLVLGALTGFSLARTKLK